MSELNETPKIYWPVERLVWVREPNGVVHLDTAMLLKSEKSGTLDDGRMWWATVEFS